MSNPITTIDLDPTKGMSEAQLIELNAAMTEQETTVAAYKALEDTYKATLEEIAYGLGEKLELAVSDKADRVSYAERKGQPVSRPITQRDVTAILREVHESVDAPALAKLLDDMGKAKHVWDVASERFLRALSCKRES